MNNVSRGLFATCSWFKVDDGSYGWAVAWVIWFTKYFDVCSLLAAVSEEGSLFYCALLLKLPFLGLFYCI